MIDNSKYFKFNGEWIYDKFPNTITNQSDFRIASSSNGMYELEVTGPKKIIEDSIPGKSTPYFYGVDFKPQTLSITLALENPKTITELRSVFRWLLNVDGYKELIFDSDPTKIYYAMFTGEPQFTYIEQNSKLIGYITLTARCNSHSAYAAVETNPITTTSFILSNDGDESTYTDIAIVFPAGATITPAGGSIYITNTTNGSVISFQNISESNTISIDMGTRIIESTISNIYDQWNREYLELEIGDNNIEVTFKTSVDGVFTPSGAIDITFEYQPVRYF
jgi:predicted phage tail component-like protein